jgi:hypothetical protein
MARRSKADPTKAKPSDSEPRALAAPPAEAAPDTEQLRYALVHKLMLFASDWRRCPRRSCRRAKRCTEQGLDCSTPPRRERPMTAEQEAEMKAQLKRALERRLGEVGSAKGR